MRETRFKNSLVSILPWMNIHETEFQKLFPENITLLLHTEAFLAPLI